MRFGVLIDGVPVVRLDGVDPSGPEWDAYKAGARAIGNGGKILMIHSDAPPA